MSEDVNLSVSYRDVTDQTRRKEKGGIAFGKNWLTLQLE